VPLVPLGQGIGVKEAKGDAMDQTIVANDVRPDRSAAGLNGASCCFCDEILSGVMPKEYCQAAGRRCRVVHQERAFVVFPSLSPLHVGHLLVVPRIHVRSFVQLSACDFGCSTQLIRNLSGVIEQRFGDALIWEHGIAVDSSGGCGVSHAHIHILPLGAEKLERVLAGLDRYFSMAASVSLEKLKGQLNNTNTYLFWQAGNHLGRVVVSDAIPSQFMRKLVAQVLESTEWDWKETYNWDMFVSTIELLGTEGGIRAL
jgi:diadenosine tetraphosphate (Ap4A) HIT family hydrolase